MEEDQGKKTSTIPRNFGKSIDISRIIDEVPEKGILMAGLVPTPSDSNPTYIWISGYIHTRRALDFFDYQRCNKIPMMDVICYKTTIFSALNEIRKVFPYQYDCYPRSFLLPSEYSLLKREHMKISSQSSFPPTWVIKPKNSCCGKGIKIIQSVTDISESSEQAVAQLYVQPFLINEKKFDFRFYLLIGCLDPLNLYFYHEGICRFCSEDYQAPSKANREYNFIHLTNTSINVQNEDASPESFTFLASDVIKAIQKQNILAAKIWENMYDVARAVILGILPRIFSFLPKQVTHQKSHEQLHFDYTYTPSFLKKSVNSRTYSNAPSTPFKKRSVPIKKRYFHILGIDIILDQYCKPYVLELNDRPSFQVTVPFERDLKINLIKEAFEHIDSFGECYPDCPESGWHRIFPVETSNVDYANWNMIYSYAKTMENKKGIETPSPVKVNQSIAPSSLLFTQRNRFRHTAESKRKPSKGSATSKPRSSIVKPKTK